MLQTSVACGGKTAAADDGGARRPSILTLLSDNDKRRYGRLFYNQQIMLFHRAASTEATA